VTPPSKYKGTGNYGDLMESEQAYWNEYTNLRQISDWPGFDAAQDQRKSDSRAWITARMQYIDDLANGKVEGEKSGWDTSNRGKRYDYLSGLNSGSPKHEVRLPASGSATNAEKVYIEEREVYLVFGSVDEKQKARKQANVDWLVTQRKKLWHLMQDDPGNNKSNDRQTRYDNLCIATHYGSAYDQWNKDHNKWGEPYTPDKPSSSSQRQNICTWLDKYVGVSENPKGSNKGSPQPDGWEKKVYGGTGVPWCACFSVCSAWENGISGSGTASVSNNTQLAKNGQGIYKGYTTDPSKVQKGDHMFKNGDHTGVARGTLQSDGTILGVEGNTSGSSSSGDQWNGDVVAKKTRPASYWTGYGLIRASS
jgi:hypothetical protein